jgi:hypothetical protein
MKTDVPLKRLTQLCPNDILMLIGETTADVLGVETLELPASKISLDSLLRLQRPGGSPYLHLIEWQGWDDSVLLWRTLSYLGWLGQNRSERPILVTIVYLKPEDDVGNILEQQIDGSEGWIIRLPSVRMWQQDATIAMASGAPGLLALAPLMQGATSTMVEVAAQRLIQETAQPLQGELLAALGIFAEPLYKAERFIRLVTKERLMTTDLISYLLQDKVAEFEQEKAIWLKEKEVLSQEKEVLSQEKEVLSQEKEVLSQEKEVLSKGQALLMAQVISELQQSVSEIITARFPTVSVEINHKLLRITEPLLLKRLRREVLVATDGATVEQLVNAAAHNAG